MYKTSLTPPPRVPWSKKPSLTGFERRTDAACTVRVQYYHRLLQLVGTVLIGQANRQSRYTEVPGQHSSATAEPLLEGGYHCRIERNGTHPHRYKSTTSQPLVVDH